MADDTENDEFSVTDLPDDVRESDVPLVVEEMGVDVEQREYNWNELPQDLQRKLKSDQEHDLERKQDEEIKHRSEEREQDAEEAANPDAHRDEPPYRS